MSLWRGKGEEPSVKNEKGLALRTPESGEIGKNKGQKKGGGGAGRRRINAAKNQSNLLDEVIESKKQREGFHFSNEACTGSSGAEREEHSNSQPPNGTKRGVGSEHLGKHCNWGRWCV